MTADVGLRKIYESMMTDVEAVGKEFRDALVPDIHTLQWPKAQPEHLTKRNFFERVHD